MNSRQVGHAQSWGDVSVGDVVQRRASGREAQIGGVVQSGPCAKYSEEKCPIRGRKPGGKHGAEHAPEGAIQH